ncbi:MAG: hypothetical protein QME62_10740 [Armatimonadota bacterium]|nr:hypothetical protein [Armatimonadota bacterium]
MNEPQKSAVWGTLIVILLVIAVIVLVAYFAWWVPTHRSIAKNHNSSREIMIFIPMEYPESIFSPLYVACRGDNYNALYEALITRKAI